MVIAQWLTLTMASQQCGLCSIPGVGILNELWSYGWTDALLAPVASRLLTLKLIL